MSCLRVTDPPRHHFFGYYEKSPWNADGSVLLAHETEFQDRRPTADDAAAICLIDEQSGEIDRVGETTAWDFQQGAMLQWLGPDFERRVIYNDRSSAGFVSRIHDLEHGKVRTINHPVYAVNPDGKIAFTLDYDRLDVTRPGYGYAPSGDPTDPAAHPPHEGVYRVSLDHGSAELLVSLAELAAHDPEPTFADGIHWVNHIQRSPSGERIAFIHRSETDDDRRWLDRLIVIEPDGTDLQVIHTGFVSHYDWRTDEELLAWTDHDGQAFFQYDLASEPVPIGRDVLPRDGHNSFSPDGQWLLLDSSPDTNRQQGLYLYHLEREALHELESLYAPPVEQNSLRCDLHPRWDRSGERICFDSTHEGGRQMYILDVRDYTNA